MFETSTVRENAIPADRRAGLVTLSIALHSFVAMAAIGMALTHLELPRQAPNQIALFQVSPVVDLPQPKGRPDADPKGDGKPKAKAVSAVRPMPPQPLTQVVPQNVPDAIPRLPSDSKPDSALARTDTGSDASGSGVDMSRSGNGERRGIPDAIDIGERLTEEPVPSDTPLVIRGDVKAPVIIERVAPAYPESLRRIRMAGVLRLLCVIDRQGSIRDAKVVSSSFAGFDQAALDAVRKWRFVAGSLHGRPVDTYFELTITFSVR